MNPIKTEAVGFYPFARFPGAIDWSAMPSVVAIQGDNGEGKTSLLALDFLALYGRDPNPARGTIHDCLRFGGASEGWIETTFAVRGVHYRIRREASISPQRHQAWLYRLDPTGGLGLDGGDTCIAGPLVRDANAAVAALVGDEDLALATWFAAQGGHGDLCSLAPADRRKVFAELLRLAEVQGWADRCKSLASETKGAAEMLDAEVAGAKDPSAEIAALESGAEAAEARAVDAAERIPVAEAALADARKAIARMEADGGAERLEADIAEADRLGRAVRDAEGSLAEARGRLAKAETAARDVDAATDAVAELMRARGDMSALLEQSDRFAKFRDWRTKRDAAEARVAAEKRRLDDATAAARVSPEDISAAADLDALLAAYRNAEAQNTARAGRNAKLLADRLAKQSAIRTCESRIAELDRELASAPVLPGPPDVCATCPLTKRWAEPAERERFASLLAEASAALAAIPMDESPIDLSELRAKGEAARDAAARMKAGVDAGARVEICNAALAAATDAYNRISTGAPPETSDPTATVRIVSSRLEKLSGAEERLAKAEDARDSLPDLIAARDKAQAAVVDLLDAGAIADDKAKAARRALDRLDEALREAREDEARKADAVAKLRHDIAEASQDRAIALGSIETLRARRDEIEGKREKARELRRRLEGLKTLAEAFGPRGVQAILIDRAAPELEAILADLLAEISGGSVAMRISTQSATKGGGIREDFVISFADADGERDVAAISGGEQRIARTALKLALAEWAARLHGTRAEHIRLDEAMDALDPTNAEAMVALIRAQGERIGRAIVVTHDPDVAARFPARIVVAGGIRVEGGDRHEGP